MKYLFLCLAIMGCTKKDPLQNPPPTPTAIPNASPTISPTASPVPTIKPTPAPTANPTATPDNSSFTFPSQPVLNCDDPSSRYTNLGFDPVSGDPFYEALSIYCNPLPGSHLFAGLRPNGNRLWVPKTAQPWAIRFLLTGGSFK